MQTIEAVTHPETAWLLRAAPALLAALITMTATFALRQPLVQLLARLTYRRAHSALDPALVWRPTLHGTRDCGHCCDSR
ncbi:hypothetical protein [Chloroflexus sp.]|uniref:hypothetical protein n=1 Tax=Chloroflexus sp. TaxID=1904827 RepID=UPI00262CB026|nr:hypothetical protein [uncultured Chloroflexus sp.]